MRLRTALAVGALAAATVSAGAPSSSVQPLAWSPPTLSAPLVLAVTNANRRLVLDDTRDYRLRIVEPLKRELWIEGGRNVVVVGGRITVDELGPFSSYQDNTALKIRHGDPAGTVHVEGLLIDGPHVNDGIAIATGRDVQIENVRVERAYDDIKGGHADCLQVQAGVGQLRVDRFTCTTERQGIFLADETGPIEGVELRRVNVAAAGGNHLFWQAHASHRVLLRNVWLSIAPGFHPQAPFGYWVYPQKDGRTYEGEVDRSRRAVVAPGKRRLWFVGSKISGVIRRGLPASGDFVTPDAVGVGYASPGYVRARG